MSTDLYFCYLNFSSVIPNHHYQTTPPPLLVPACPTIRPFPLLSDHSNHYQTTPITIRLPLIAALHLFSHVILSFQNGIHSSLIHHRVPPCYNEQLIFQPSTICEATCNQTWGRKQYCHSLKTMSTAVHVSSQAFHYQLFTPATVYSKYPTIRYCFHTIIPHIPYPVFMHIHIYMCMRDSVCALDEKDCGIAVLW